MTIKDWVHNERFVELWNEGHRFFDVRRWAEGAKYFGANKREGLNAEVQSPTFDLLGKGIETKRSLEEGLAQAAKFHEDSTFCPPEVVGKRSVP